MAEEKKEMLSTGKIAEQVGVSPAKVKKALEEMQRAPDQMKGKCAMFTPDTVEQVKAHLGIN